MPDTGPDGGAVSFEIDGHAYLTTLLPVDDGLDILARLVALLGEPLAALAEGVLADPAKITKLVAAARNRDDDTKVEDLLGGVSLSALGRDLRNGLAGANAIKVAPLARDLVKWTHRDNKPLRDPAHYNEAFRGNYRELGALVWKLIQINRLFPLPGI